MRAILACAVFAFLGFGCAGNLDPEVGEEEAPLVENGVSPNAFTCLNPPTCVAECGCDYGDCLASGAPKRTCDEEKFQCALGCKR